MDPAWVQWFLKFRAMIKSIWHPWKDGYATSRKSIRNVWFTWHRRPQPYSSVFKNAGLSVTMQRNISLIFDSLPANYRIYEKAACLLAPFSPSCGQRSGKGLSSDWGRRSQTISIAFQGVQTALDREELSKLLNISFLPISQWIFVQNGQDTHQTKGLSLRINLL